MNTLAMLSLRTITLALCLSLSACSQQPAETQEEAPLAGATIGAPFTLTGGDGQKVSWSDFDGRYRMVYFGYTSCPDVCPYDVQRMVRAWREFRADRPDTEVVPIFITADPGRDTPEALADYTKTFSPELVGLTGSEEEIAQVASDFAAYRKLEQADEYGFYKVQHGPPGAYLFGPEGEPLALLPVDESVEATLAEMKRWTR